MPSNDVLGFTGDFTLETIEVTSVTGQKVDIREQVVSIELFEDIFSPFRTATIVMKDSADLLNILPFIGEEILELKVETPSYNRPIEGTFYIYKAPSRVRTSNKESMYTLQCISKDWLADINSKISKTFKGSCSDIAYELIKDGLVTDRKAHIGTTTNQTAFTAGFWSPIKCINHLATLSVGRNNSPTFVFFENRYGYNFACINDLLTNESYQLFTQDNFSRTVTDDGITTIRDPNKEYKRILEIHTPDTGDFMQDQLQGKFKTTLWSHDITTKYGFIEKRYNLATDKSINLLNENRSHSKNPLTSETSKFILANTQYNLYEGFENTTNNLHVQSRAAFFNDLMKFKVNLLVRGRTDYTVGQIMELYIPKMTQLHDNLEDNKDEVLSGRYLCIAIGHFFTREGHKCSIELTKNSMLMEI